MSKQRSEFDESSIGPILRTNANLLGCNAAASLQLQIFVEKLSISWEIRFIALAFNWRQLIFLVAYLVFKET